MTADDTAVYDSVFCISVLIYKELPKESQQ